MSSSASPFAFVSMAGNSRQHPDAGEIGHKAAGLARLPRSWTPPFLVLGPSFTAGWKRTGSAAKALGFDDSAASGRRLLARFAPNSTSPLLIRSNGSAEAARPGLGATVVIRGGVDALLAGLDDYLDQQLDRAPDLLPLLQRGVEPAFLGLLSNDRGLTADPRRWLVEEVVDRRFLTTYSTTIENTLTATGGASLRPALRSVAKRLQHGDDRYRVEWLWDGDRIWVVQADPIPDHRRRGCGFTLPATRVATRGGSLIESARFGGAKVSRWRAMADAGLPTYPLLVITGEEALTPAAPEKLNEFVARFSETAVVARTDLAHPDATTTVLLPTSSPSREPTALLRFVADAADQFAAEGLAPSDWAVLFSPLYPVGVSALAWAEPTKHEVRIDALWGYPDGVMNLPHDSFVVPGPARRRFKGVCLAPAAGEWKMRDVLPPLDWGRTLSRAELETIAAWARTMARHQSSAVMLMVLARVGGGRGPSGCLPFYFEHRSSCGRAEIGLSRHARTLPVMRNSHDLESLDRRCDSVQAVRLRPDPAQMRDGKFLTRVGTWAASKDISIVFEGSALGHPFYLLQSTGARVVRDTADAIENADVADSHLCPAVVNFQHGLKRVLFLPRSSLSALHTGPRRRQQLPSDFKQLPAVAEGDVPKYVLDQASRSVPLFGGGAPRKTR